MNIHNLRLDIGGASPSIEFCTSIEICKICSTFCGQILSHFVRVTLKNHSSERSQMQASNTLIKWYWSMLERIVAQKAGVTPPKVKIYAVTGLNMADQCDADVSLAFKTFFNLDKSLSLQEISSRDPVLLIQLLTIIVDGCTEKLKERLHTPRETVLMGKCIQKVHQACENMQSIINGVLQQHKPFPERQTRLYVTQLKIEFIKAKMKPTS
jgi:hypothetical protein